MQIKVFTVSAFGDRQAEEELNRFLRGHRVLEVGHEFVNDGANSSWCFCVSYLESAPTFENRFGHAPRVDYKQVLDEKTFDMFARLRDCRKRIALDEGIPAFAVFTDAELAGLARLDTLSSQAMMQVPGVGQQKVKRFGLRIMELMETGKGDETGR